MKKSVKKYLLIFLTIMIVLVCGYFEKNNSHRSEKEYINKVLVESNYSYLSPNTKEYIKEMYEKTGEVILTEKNKKADTPYLNPKYDDYLSMSEEEKERVDIVPNIYVIDYSPNNIVEDVSLPSSYNLSNVNNKNFLTPINDQGNLGICWAFASVEQAESLLMVKNNQSYSSSNQRFSVRQMDYATSVDGINNYENENGFRILTSGGNYFMSSLIMSYGLSLTNYTEYEESTVKKELSDVLNYKNANYELNSSIIMPQISSNDSEATKTAYNNLIKANIITYGGAYVGTGAPTGNCGFENTDGAYTIVDADNCIGTSGHAMQIIGWNDNYEYSYCKVGSNHLSVNNQGTCDSGTLVTGTGAWILRNSWGDDLAYKYIYMGYKSYGYEVSFTTSLTSMNDRLWDNVYHKNIWKDGTASKTTDTVIYNKRINTSEKVEEVKVMMASLSGEYNISIESGGNVYKNIKSFEVDYPGIYTINLSNNNIILDDQQFKVTVNSTNNSYIVANTISVFTSNIDSTPIIKTENMDGSSVNMDSNNNYEFIAYSVTKNIDSNELVTYSLHKDNNDYSNYIVSYSNNKVAENNVNATLVINKNIPVDNYKLKVHYNDYSSETNLTIPLIYNLQGSGTSDDPYQIYDEDDLDQIRFNLDAYYLLKNDITLTKNWVPLGNYAEPFRGGIDGDNHSITGLTIEANGDDAVGLFGYVAAKYDYKIQKPTLEYIEYDEKTYIKNLKIVNSQISNNGNVGVLIGQLTYNTNDAPDNAINIGSPSLTIDNVHFINGSVTSLNGDAGAIIGNINIIPSGFNRPYLDINNVYSSLTISGKHSIGLIGYVNDSYESGSMVTLQLSINNFQNVGIIDIKSLNIDYADENNYSTVIGGFYGNIKIVLSNFIINSIFNDEKYSFDFASNHGLYYIGYYDSKTSQNFTHDVSHGYYISSWHNLNQNLVSSSSIKNNSLYNSWTNFNNYWKIETINGITRIPVLKSINYNYTDVSNISIDRYDKVSLLDYINGASDYQYIEYSVISNNDIIDIKRESTNGNNYYDNLTIEALNKGTATIHIINNYDGFEKNINITVTAEKVNNPIITYYYNSTNNNESYTQQVMALETFNLMKNQFTRAGYTFNGWNTMANGGGTAYDDEATIISGFDENIKLYAQWIPTPYTITFNANGGVGTMSSQTISSGLSIALPNNTFTRSGYTFVNWNTQADGNGTTYSDGQTITPESNLTLYAQWQSNTGTITFNSNYGANVTTVQNITFNVSTKLAKNTFTREGYNFVSWNTQADGNGVTYTDEQTSVFNTSLVLYAIWQDETIYTIRNYDVDETNRYISKIMVNTEPSAFTPNFTLGYGYGIDVDTKTVNDKQVLYTGGKTRITHGLDIYREFTNVVIGDIDGDGEVNSADLLKVRQHLMDINTLTGIYFLSSDVNYDDVIDSADLLRVRQHLLGTNPIE